MTERRATARTTAEARAKTTSNAGILRFAQDDKQKQTQILCGNDKKKGNGKDNSISFATLRMTNRGLADVLGITRG
jgi:hypothetical protein